VIAASTAAQLLIVSEKLAAEERAATGATLWNGSRASIP